MLRSLSLAILFLFFIQLHAQGTWDIKDPGDAMQAKCGECLAALKAKPKEIQFGLFADDNKDVWFVVSSEAFFDVLLKRASDGIAVDVVPRSLYDCSAKEPPQQTRFYKGTLMKPAYLPELKRSKKVGPGGIAVKVGRLPAHLANEPYELNLIVLKDRNVCYYNAFYDLQAYRWDLLNMGLYMDTLTYGQQFDSTRNARATSIMRRKALHFTIPFERNKSEYSPKDLQPLYDSLRLTDFTIKRIQIEAYSSVEGPEERNLELQQKRAQSIVSALQSFQSPNIETTVQASENWVEFLRDVTLTSHADLADLPKAEVKKRLLDRHVAEQLEPILAHHRKALITLELRRKDGLAGLSEDQLVRQFEKAIVDKNIARARELQNTVMERIMDEELPNTFLDKLEVPMQRDYAALINSRTAFHYFEDGRDALETYTALLELQRILPEDAHINYNLCAVKFRVWLQGGATAVDPAQFKKEIEALRAKFIDEPLVKRMLINHAIIMAEIHMAKGEYAKKDEAIKYIHRNYKSIPMAEQDYLSLAQYFASFANYEQSISVVEPQLTGVDADEDLLFYYLNLTIFNQEQTKNANYRRIMLNAINKNKKRYCDLFEPFGHGGITFQLLDNPYLFTTYCETCR
jgi:hypothetical protein